MPIFFHLSYPQHSRNYSHRLQTQKNPMSRFSAIIPTITKLLLVFLPLSYATTTTTTTTDTITQSQPLPDGTTLVSKDGIFQLGFFQPSTSNTNRYIGIWYNTNDFKEKTVVWVGNRENPLKQNSSNSSLSINTEGNLVLSSQNQTIFVSNSTRKGSNYNIVAQLLDTGNLVLRDEQEQNNGENYIWQSFDYPCDTWLPGMKIGWDLKSGINRRLTAWKNWDDPSLGDFTFGVEFGVVPQLVTRKGVQLYLRNPWNGVKLLGKSTPIFHLKFIVNQNEVVYTSNVQNKSIITRVVLNQTDHLRERYVWNQQTKSWKLYSFVPKEICDGYNPCGPNGNCVTSESPPCHCLTGFKPKSEENYNALDWTQGCVRSKTWSCNVKNKDGFQKFNALKLPDTVKSWGNASMSLEDCKAKCLENCSCMAYANMYINGGGTGCLIWFGNLIDLRVDDTGSGQDFYIRMATSNIEGAKKHKKMVVVIVATTISFVLVMLLTFSCIRRRNGNHREKNSEENNDESKQEDMDLPFFDIVAITRATNDFSSENKLGQGGFGPVYKGTLRDGQEIAVKRLSQSSGQGLIEFKNEIIMCAKLQHRNLVKVLGCCIQREEKMVVYEYMPNKSLDSILFDCHQSKPLNWPQRFHIICGIARGLLYLHQDSRLRIIHRDLKTSNVLLDRELNAKISDFGMARMFGGDQIEGNTNRVVGTYGYMAPEYVAHGLFSIKSDVFSFGVLLLEIVSGKKNRTALYPNSGFNLIGHAWKLWKGGNTKDLVDCSMEETFNLSEILRCIHISLLCVQLHFEDRPNMASVLMMLSSENALPEPKEPAFLIERTLDNEGENSSYDQMMFSSSNELSVTLLQAR